MIVVGTVSGTILVAPLVAALAVGIGVPILLAYVYGVVPISLCRSGGCGVTTNNNGGVRFAFDDENTDSLNFFTQTNPNNASTSSGVKLALANSVTVPISAIEPRPDSITMARTEPADATSQTPVLVTITMASRAEQQKSRQKSANRHRSSSRNRKDKKAKEQTRARFGGVVSATCGSVELNKVSPGKKRTVAAEVANGSAMSSLAAGLSPENHSDGEHNLSSSSSSQHLLEVRHDESTTTQPSRPRYVNPSIGEMSIGNYTMTSLSNSGSNLCGVRANLDDVSDIDGEETEERGDHESASTKAIASINQLSVDLSVKSDKKSTVNNDIDNYSVSMLSEKSMNPSIVALAGSLR